MNMNNRSLVKLSNIIGIISIILLVYWVFIFLSITVFGFRIFRENLTETFYLSIVGILALMIGALILNVMINMTRIAEKHNLDKSIISKKEGRKLWLIFALSFPIIFVLLFAGDYLTSVKKEKILLASAKSIVEDNPEKSGKLLKYDFSRNWIVNTQEILNLYSRTDKHFPYVSVIVADSIDNSLVYLNFGEYYGMINDTIQPKKIEYIRQTTKEEREYLKSVFFNNSDNERFSAKDGKYELFYPYAKG